MGTITYDCKGFGLHDMALLNKHHDPHGGASHAKYRYYGDVQIISTERLFKVVDIPRDESFSINGPNIDVKDEFRILFVKDFDDPFYLRLLENMMPLDELEYPEDTQVGSQEKAQLMEAQKSSKKGSDSRKLASIKNQGPLEIPAPLAKKLKEKLQLDRRNEKKRDEKASAKKEERSSTETEPRLKATQASEKETSDRKRSSDEEELKTEPTLPDE